MSAPVPVHYRVQLHDLHAHLFRVIVTIAQPACQQQVALPVWIPGSYLIREFAKNLQNLHATQTDPQGKSQVVTIRPLSKHCWEMDCQPEQALELTYEVCAYDPSVRAAWLDQNRGFFNGTSLLVRVIGQQQQAHRLQIQPPHTRQPLHWQLATGLTAIATDEHGFGTYAANNYDELVDCPVEMGHFWSGSFIASGIPHRFVVAGAPASFNGQRLLDDTQKICETAIRFWHPSGEGGDFAPHRNYVFMLNATHDGYGGLEHRNSTALICSRADLPRLDKDIPSDGYTTLLGLISHEYFHTWNVKRLRPAEFTCYDYDRENYTQLLWFFEGFTSYYDDLLLHRAGLIDSTSYLRLLGKTINQVQQTPGRYRQSVAQSSFDAWVKYYRQDENTANATISYYTKGALIALCLDLTLRQEHATTLDVVMRTLWQRCQGGPLSEGDMLAVLQQLTHRDWTQEIQAWVHGTDDLPVQQLLSTQGVRIETEPFTPAQALGLRVQENHSIHIRQVLRASLAEQAGMMAGDEWYGIELAHHTHHQGYTPQGWRLNKLEELALYTAGATEVIALVARDRQLLRLSLLLPAADSAVASVLVKLSRDGTDKLDRWLAVE